MIIQSPSDDTTVSDADIKQEPGQDKPRQDFRQQAHSTIDRISEALGSFGQRAGEYRETYGQKAAEQVRARPLAAVGAAVVVGMLLSKLLGGRR